jgi:hypothetical protein
MGRIMNERIRQLAKQAYLYQEDDNFLTAALEHFAELIVKECGAVALNIGCGDIEDELLKHFGVEE